MTKQVFCEQCGTAVLQTARFCKSCGSAQQGADRAEQGRAPGEARQTSPAAVSRAGTSPSTPGYAPLTDRSARTPVRQSAQGPAASPARTLEARWLAIPGAILTALGVVCYMAYGAASGGTAGGAMAVEAEAAFTDDAGANAASTAGDLAPILLVLGLLLLVGALVVRSKTGARETRGA